MSDMKNKEATAIESMEETLRNERKDRKDMNFAVHFPNQPSKWFSSYLEMDNWFNTNFKKK